MGQIKPGKINFQISLTLFNKMLFVPLPPVAKQEKSEVDIFAQTAISQLAHQLAVMHKPN
ncbi:MAG TPA: hypothetical protein VFM79_10595 [Pelobium sp.]|nr:hypothetical protein [Pelobium sp.]